MFSLAILIQGSRWYGRFDFANSIFFVNIVFGQRSYHSKLNRGTYLNEKLP